MIYYKILTSEREITLASYESQLRFVYNSLKHSYIIKPIFINIRETLWQSSQIYNASLDLYLQEKRERWFNTELSVVHLESY